MIVTSNKRLRVTALPDCHVCPELCISHVTRTTFQLLPIFRLWQKLYWLTVSILLTFNFIINISIYDTFNYLLVIQARFIIEYNIVRAFILMMWILFYNRIILISLFNIIVKFKFCLFWSSNYCFHKHFSR